MKAFIVVFWASALLAQGTLGMEQPCQTRSQWGDSACSLGGSIQVKSVPNNLEVSSQKCDVFYSKSEFQKQPVVLFPDAKPGEKYTLLLVDPDAPKHPKGTFYLHWIQANIPGDDLKKGDFKNSKTITSYRGPAPPNNTGVHRYILLAYRQSPASRVSQEVPDDQRSMFNLDEWLNKNKLCGPESGVQFRSNFSGDPKSQS